MNTDLGDGFRGTVEGDFLWVGFEKWIMPAMSREVFSRLVSFAAANSFAAVDTSQWESAARAQGWSQSTGYIFGNNLNHRRIYDSWQDCCIGEGIKVPMDSGEKTVLAVLDTIAKDVGE